MASNAAQEAAAEIVARLRAAGHLAYFVGGCVRDLLLGRSPKDFDVATSAPPDQVLTLFEKTFAVGAHFGVVLVCSGEIVTEVATFRSDGAYSDGRRPDAVQFSTSPEEDVKRRDFTINGMMLDPVDNSVLDFVGGMQDLQSWANTRDWGSRRALYRRQAAPAARCTFCGALRLRVGGRYGEGNGAIGADGGSG